MVRTGRAAALAVVVVATAVWPSSAATLRLPANSDGIVQFALPAGEIGCTYIPFDGAGGIETGAGTGPELHCYRMAGKFEAVSLGAGAKARKLRVTGKLNCCGDNVLAYGATWVTGGYSCTAAKASLSCRRGPHGFRITPSAITRH